jgi:tetratricopeptide (TPR) repeat protein
MKEQDVVHSWKLTLIPPSILTILTTLFYLPSLTYPFQFDDIANISKKFYIRFDNPLARWWLGPRWLGDWINRLNYMIGRFEPFYYRIANLAIHLFTGLLIFYLIQTLCRRLTNHHFFRDNATFIGFVTAALFLLHPVQTQTVSYVIQARIEGLASFFVILLVFCFVHASSAPQKFVRYLSLGFLFIFGLLAWGTKEIVIITPLLFLLVDWFFIAQMNWDDLKKRLWLHVLFDVYFIGLALHYLTTKFAVDVVTLKSASGNNRGNILTQHAYDVITPYQFFISEFKVMVHYLWMFIWPFGTSVEYDWRLSPGFFSPDAFFPFTILVVIYGWALYAMVKKIYPAVVFGLLWFLVCVAPRSSIIPSPELVCDYKTYLASLGWLFVLSLVVVYLVRLLVDFVLTIIPEITKKLVPFNVHMVAFTIILLPVGISALFHNKIWESSVVFWQYNAEHAPMKARVHNNYGVALNEAGMIDESIKSYQRAIDLDKHYSDPLSNIAVAYCLKNEIDKAIDSLKSALHICPNYPEAYNNLGTLLIKKKQYDEAEHMLSVAVELRPYYGKAYYNLGRLYLEKNQQETAWNYFKKAVESDLDNPDGFFTFAQMSMRLKKYPEAASAFEQVIERGCSNDQVWFGLANAHYMLGNYDKAESIYVRLVRDNPLDGRYMYNLGETWFTQKEYAKASEIFKRGTSLPKPLPQTFFRVAACLEKMKKFNQAQAYLNDLLKINAPEEFKSTVKKEMMRIALQEKVSQGNGKIALTDLKNAIALKNTPPTNKPKTA